ncbi:putative GNAT family acetyltransferase [Annulohypoxylon truncatum]|uniref:putative GNAT family acetyltransferase n=1 Tax=Annulohypoxylon truncatum TaxID=327061 RepID=UPI002008770F|nr:putative GNAT family acetyltransferase [Annulohypoxylon truncatum]KAI1205193.1 putative GNAT family acetyltransferase [Annulohypoxylon truncatum]
MPLALATAQHADAARIAEIHMAAFGSNAMLLAQFPTIAVRDSLKECIRSKAHADIDDPNITVLVVRDSDTIGLGENKQDHKRPATERVVAFAKWAHPVSTDEEYAETPWIWPDGTDLKVLQEWTRKVEDTQAHAVGESPYYRKQRADLIFPMDDLRELTIPDLSFIGTDPSYERRGAATMMIQWGIDQCKKHGVPAYLESTLEAAPLYRKLGFIEMEKISLDYEVAGSEITQTYEEIGFVYR